jgi:hypothetical protein
MYQKIIIGIKNIDHYKNKGNIILTEYDALMEF